MTSEQIKDYLNHTCEMEISIYKLEKAHNAAMEALNANPPKKILFDRPIKPEEQKPMSVDALDKQIEASSKKTFGGRGMVAGGCLFIFLGILFIVLGSVGGGIFELIMGGLLLIGGIYRLSKGPKEIKELENKAEIAQQENIKRAEEENLRLQRQYEESLMKYSKDTERENERFQAATQQYEIATENVSQLKKTLEETKHTLENLYAIGIIFPKYRNLIAASSMYEYFLVGRCYELEGPDGAYNLYEDEIRHGVIFNKIDTIVSKLDEIKQNQYLLYSELQKANSVINDIASEIETMCTGTDRMEQATTIVALCSQATDQNTNVLKYITQING